MSLVLLFKSINNKISTLPKSFELSCQLAIQGIGDQGEHDIEIPQVRQFER